MTPNIAIVHVHNPYWPGFRLWIPLFLLWVPLVILSPLIFLALLVFCIAGKIRVWHAISVFWGVLCGLPGTDVQVKAQGNQVLVEIL